MIVPVISPVFVVNAVGSGSGQLEVSVASCLRSLRTVDEILNSGDEAGDDDGGEGNSTEQSSGKSVLLAAADVVGSVPSVLLEAGGSLV